MTTHHFLSPFYRPLHNHIIRPAHPLDFPFICSLATENIVYQPNMGDLAQTDVITQQQMLIGFASWQVVCDEATLLGIAIHIDRQRNGYATALLNHGHHRLSHNGIQRFYLEVRISNYAAIELYKKHGYHIISERKNYYPTQGKSRETALILSKTVDNPLH